MAIVTLERVLVSFSSHASFSLPDPIPCQSQVSPLEQPLNVADVDGFQQRSQQPDDRLSSSFIPCHHLHPRPYSLHNL
jgi:hypothetical protein